MASAAFAFGGSEAFVVHAAVEANASASRSAIAESLFITLSPDSFRDDLQIEWIISSVISGSLV
jgi:hypothetical protein